MRIILPLAFVALTIGCAKDPSAIQKVGDVDAAALNSTHTRFDASDDPPFSADTRYAAGQLAESQGQPVRAIEQYRQAVKLDPKHQASLYRMGVIHTQAKQYNDAIDAWKQYVKASNGSATAYSNLAFCYELAGKLDEAEAAYKSGVQAEPHNQPCRTNYGLMLARKGRTSEAVSQLSIVLSPAEVHYNLASVYEQQGHKEDARREYQKALELDPRLWEAMSRLSKLE